MIEIRIFASGFGREVTRMWNLKYWTSNSIPIDTLTLEPAPFAPLPNPFAIGEEEKRHRN
jgi:hypothetical protein